MARLFITFYISIILALFGFIVAFDTVTTEAFYDLETEDARSTINSYLELLGKLHQYEGDEATLQSAQRLARLNDNLLEPLAPGVLTTEERAALSAGEMLFFETEEDEDVVYFRIPQLQQDFSLRMDPNSALVQYNEMISNMLIIGFLVIIALVTGLSGYLLQRRLKRLQQATLAFADGDFSARAPEKRSLRVGSMNAAFNQMAEQIESLIASHKRLTNAVAHELRTPIFRLRCQLELLDHDLSIQEHQQYCEGMEEDLMELDELVDELLSYARMQRNDIQLELHSALLDQWLLEQYSRLDRSCHKALTLTPSRRPMPANIDGRLLLRALSNLIRNADNHAASRIAIRLEELPPCYCLHVDDDGPGIPEADRARVFEPFERLDSARTRATGGHGLGLSIVREIMLQHGGHVEISDSPLGGARVTLCLPAS